MLCAWSITEDGRKVLLHLAPGTKEDTASGTAFFDACIAHLRFPLRHRKVIRTTNLLERLFLGGAPAHEAHSPRLRG